MNQHPVEPSTTMQQPLLFLPALFNETLDLLLEAHDYFHHAGVSEHGDMTMEHQSLFANEMSRVTMRLTSIMAWIMVRKAVFSGKLTHEEAQRNFRLDGKEICLQHPETYYQPLPHYMKHLLTRSHTLYTRVSRIDNAEQLPTPALASSITHVTLQ